MAMHLIVLVLSYSAYCGDVADDIRTKAAAAIQALTPDQRWAIEHGQVFGYQNQLFRGSTADLENYPPSRRALLVKVHARTCQEYKGVMESQIAGR
jgi:hypothetical protein